MEVVLFRRKPILLSIVLLPIIVAVFYFSHISLGMFNVNETNFKHVEIREYQGQKLSSINDFRENSIKGPQIIDEEKYKLVVVDLKGNVKEYTYEDVVSSHEVFEKVVTLHCVEGWQVTILWEGFLVKELIEEIGEILDAKVVIFYASDGYSTSLPLDYIIDNNIMIAYKMNGITLPPDRGFPFQLVAESKYGYKWIKWITRIELSENDDYLGYWESRGFPNDANLP
jgi:DMSO/TMAO reductase YedYZ molybdopterin-dependent catalytic subunit